MVPTALVMSFGLLMCFDPVCAQLVNGWTKWPDILQFPMNRDGVGSFLLVCEYFGMYREEVSTGSNSLGPFVLG